MIPFRVLSLVIDTYDLDKSFGALVVASSVLVIDPFRTKPMMSVIDGGVQQQLQQHERLFGLVIEFELLVVVDWLDIVVVVVAAYALGFVVLGCVPYD